MPFEGHEYPHFFVVYNQTDTDNEIFAKYSSKFFNRRLLSPFKSLFGLADLKI